jgi:site-specific DNA recombinase
VTLRQDALLEPLDTWLASKFEPYHLPATIEELAAASVKHQIDPRDAEVDAKIVDCDRKLAQYRATLDAGAEPATVARWITETEAERARHKAAKRAATPRPAATSMSRDEIASIVSTFRDVLAVLRDADPTDKTEIYTQLGLRLTYQPGERLVRTEVHIAPAQHWQFESVRGGT